MSVFSKFKTLFQDQPKTKRISSDLTKELGRSGTKLYSGYSSQDFNTDFQNNQQIAIYDKMIKSDGMVNATLEAIRLPILSTEWRIEPGQDDMEDKKGIAAFVKDCFNGMDNSFEEFLNEALLYPFYGYYYFEKVFQVKNGKIVWKKFFSRVPSAHEKWQMTSDPKTPGVTQTLPTNEYDGVQVQTSSPEIPMSKLILFIHRKEGDNYDGVSVLRSAYKHWYYKDTFYRLDGIARERGAGVLKIVMPNGSTDDDRADAEELAENFKANQKSYIIAPSADWTFELMTGGFADQKDLSKDSIDHHNRMIALNILGQFLELGSSEAGSYALSKDQSEFFTLGLRSITKYVANQLNKQAIKELVDLNFGEQEYYPKFVFSDVGQIDYTEVATVLEKLINIGVVEKSNKIKIWAHKQFALPEVTMEELEEMDKEREENTPIIPKEEKVIPKNKVKDDEDIQDRVDEENEKDEEKMAELSEKIIERLKKNFKLAKYYRSLTLAEERVKFNEISDYFDDHERRVKEVLDAITEKQKAAFLKAIEQFAKDQDIKGMKDLIASFPAQLRGELKGLALEAVNEGKTQAASEIDVDISPTPTLTTQLIDVQVDSAVKDRNDKIVREVKNSVVPLIVAGVGVAAIVRNAGSIFDSVASVANSGISSMLTVSSVNIGRDIIYVSNPAIIYGLQRSEILDNKTCAMCLSLDGRVVLINDPFSKMGQVHSNCRGIWVAILKSDATLPAVNGIPKSLQSKFGTVEGVPSINNFKQPSSPSITKSSRVAQKVEDGALDNNPNI